MFIKQYRLLTVGEIKMSTNNGTGWERNKRTLFDEIVMNYDKVRWGYPDKLITDVI
jgi:hypothetical protein